MNSCSVWPPRLRRPFPRLRLGVRNRFWMASWRPCPIVRFSSALTDRNAPVSPRCKIRCRKEAAASILDAEISVCAAAGDLGNRGKREVALSDFSPRLPSPGLDRHPAGSPGIFDSPTPMPAGMPCGRWAGSVNGFNPLVKRASADPAARGHRSENLKRYSRAQAFNNISDVQTHQLSSNTRKPPPCPHPISHLPQMPGPAQQSTSGSAMSSRASVSTIS